MTHPPQDLAALRHRVELLELAVAHLLTLLPEDQWPALVAEATASGQREPFDLLLARVNQMRAARPSGNPYPGGK